MIDRLIVADMKIAMLRPLLYDKGLINKWDKSIAAHGLNLLSSTLYHDLIRELCAISLDSSSSSPSIKNILSLLESDDLRSHLKGEFIKPLSINWIGDVDEASRKFIEEKRKERELAENSERFNDSYSKVLQDYRTLKASPLFKRVRLARNKLIAHYEMKIIDGAPRMLTPSDLGLTWGDVEEYFEQVKPIVTSLLLIISNEGFALDMYREEHEKVATEFWHN